MQLYLELLITPSEVLIIRLIDPHHPTSAHLEVTKLFDGFELLPLVLPRDRDFGSGTCSGLRFWGRSRSLGFRIQGLEFRVQDFGLSRFGRRALGFRT